MHTGRERGRQNIRIHTEVGGILLISVGEWGMSVCALRHWYFIAWRWIPGTCCVIQNETWAFSELFNIDFIVFTCIYTIITHVNILQVNYTLEIEAVPEDHFRMLGVNVSLSGTIPREKSGKQHNSKILSCSTITYFCCFSTSMHFTLIVHSLPFASSGCFLAKTNRTVVAQFVQSNLVINISTFLWSKIHTQTCSYFSSCLFPYPLICHGAKPALSFFFMEQWLGDMGGCWVWTIFLMAQTMISCHLMFVSLAKKGDKRLFKGEKCLLVVQTPLWFGWRSKCYKPWV